jgi:hypothetical protein
MRILILFIWGDAVSSAPNINKAQSSICLSRDRSIASSKLSSPKSAIVSFLLQLAVSS